MIEHEGIIEQIEGDMAQVKIENVSACSSCHARGACGAAEQKEKYLDVPLSGTPHHQGDSVKVQITEHLGFRAVALGYVYPFLLLMAVLLGTLAAGTAELKAGVLALLSLVPYYSVLYLFRKSISKKFIFSIKKTLTEQ